jgi:hypothetical protein
MSINVCDAKYYGVDPADFDNIMLFWGIQAYSDRLVVENSTKVYPYWNWMLNRVFAYKEMYELHDQAGAPCVDAPDYTAMTEVNIYTYKTPDYMLSCAQISAGTDGLQQHPWTAALGTRIQVFTNSPVQPTTGLAQPACRNLNLPRAVAHNNVQLCIYRTNRTLLITSTATAISPSTNSTRSLKSGAGSLAARTTAISPWRSLRPARWLPLNPEAYRRSTLTRRRRRR